MIPVKICGITSVGDGLLASQLGAKAIGLNFYERSPRYVTSEEAKKISAEVPSTSKKVGVFVNADTETIQRVADYVKLDFIQLHGDESPEFCGLLNLPVIKAFRIKPDGKIPSFSGYRVVGVLLDTFKENQFGGTGETFNWDVISTLPRQKPLILAGGLTPENALKAIQSAKPEAIDVNSGVELNPGKKDKNKLATLFRNLQETGHYSNIFEATRKK